MSWAIDPADAPGIFGPIQVAMQARAGVKAIQDGVYARAVSSYHEAISLKADVPEFYYGLLYAGTKLENWSLVNVALEGIAEKGPEAKSHLAFEYGDYCTKTGRYEEAVPLLKKAFKNGENDRKYLTGKIQKLIAMTALPAPLVVKTQEEEEKDKEKAWENAKARVNAAPPKSVPIPPEMLNIDHNAIGNDYLSAFLKSEWIGIAEYLCYEKETADAL